MSFPPVATGPFPSYRRMRVFVDGENLVVRYQEMLKAGWEPRPEVLHLQDIYVWSPLTTEEARGHDIERCTYYTSTKGSDERVREVSAEIRKKLHVQKDHRSQLPSSLTPSVFSKVGGRSKGVDITLAVDVLTHAHQRTVDTVLLATGDGDFEPLIKEALRSGCQVWLAAFRSGLSPRLPNLVDKVIDLDWIYFKSEPKKPPAP